MNSDSFYTEMTLHARVVKLLESKNDFGGPQSVNDLCLNLKISNGNSRSVLVRLYQSGKIERIEKGIYKLKNDNRKYDLTKPHMD